MTDYDALPVSIGNDFVIEEAATALSSNPLKEGDPAPVYRDSEGLYVYINKIISNKNTKAYLLLSWLAGIDSATKGGLRFLPRIGQRVVTMEARESDRSLTYLLGVLPENLSQIGLNPSETVGDSTATEFSDVSDTSTYASPKYNATFDPEDYWEKPKWAHVAQNPYLKEDAAKEAMKQSENRSYKKMWEKTVGDGENTISLVDDPSFALIRLKSSDTLSEDCKNRRVKAETEVKHVSSGAFHYYGTEGLFTRVDGPVVRLLGNVYEETGDVYSYGGGNTYTSGDSFEYNYGKQCTENHGRSYEASFAHNAEFFLGIKWEAALSGAFEIKGGVWDIQFEVNGFKYEGEYSLCKIEWSKATFEYEQAGLFKLQKKDVADLESLIERLNTKVCDVRGGVTKEDTVLNMIKNGVSMEESKLSKGKYGLYMMTK